ncbi:hypothetical protein [Vibrio spartinae]|uniref:Uncharacterized protein n=1 Tax=Vibrio spartinae TaxID=1918945 RepID=A0A1N6M1U3_9VIBR|nr:hypothetical protein [Vibrio spartinae]QMV15469.1 hypothetical protein Vspart_02776 [Vibrio spartinae]SIO93336.1 hypothetical protein VSP9026_00995 [Vibrio spartinae]
MKAERLYYAALSAALMAKAEPALAQQLAYQLAYLSANPKLLGYSATTATDSAPTVPINHAMQAQQTTDSGTLSRQAHQALNPQVQHTQQSPQRWPINPLNHVDWLSGGRLNERWLKQQKFATGRHPHKTTRTTSRTSQRISSPADEAHIFNRINDAIMRALVQSDPDAQHKFAVALFAGLCHHRWPAPDAEREIYWLIMHSVRCYLYGTRLQWGKAFVDSTEARQSRNPMYQIVSECLNHPQPECSPITLKQVMMQLNLLPPILQIQCLTLGIVYRDPHAAATDKCSALHDVLHPPALDAALEWFGDRG